MNFLRTIGSSIHSPEFYSSVTKKSFKQSIGYFLLLALLLTIIHLITLINPLLIEAPKAISEFATQIINCFPKDLEVKITNGQVSINALQPYFVSSCEKTNNQTLLVIDTETPFSSAKFEDYKTAVWVTKDSFIYKANNNETRSYSLTKIKDFKLNKDVLNSYFNMASPYLKFVGPVLLLLTFISIYLSYDFRLIHLLIIALLVWVLSKIFKLNINYVASYKIGLYAITLGLIVELIVSLTSVWTHFYGFPFMVTILTLAVVLVNLLLPASPAVPKKAS